jgi:hypothetical protein
VNSVEQALRARNKKLEQQSAALFLTLEKLIEDLELTESVGCAFAWDLVTTLKHQRAAPRIAEITHRLWYEAGDDAQDAADEARGIKRAYDGSIISILPEAGK